MRFVTFTPQNPSAAGPLPPAWAIADADTTRVGVQQPDGTISALPSGIRLLDLLGDDGEMLDRAGQRAVADPAALFAADEVRLLPPVPTPPSVRDFMTFESHVAGAVLTRGPEATVVPEWYDVPTFYFTNPHNLVGAADPVPLPPGCAMFDFELEVAAIVGRAGSNLTPEQAGAHIVGYSIYNDWSARDLQRHEMRIGLGPAKGKDTAATLGPALVTADELAPYAAGNSFDLGMRAEINGALVGEDQLANMAWSFPELVSYASRGTWVRPGDVLGSGTCGGGCLLELWGRRGPAAHPPLQVGDTVTLRVDVLGTVRNTVAAGLPLHALPPRR